MIAAAEREECAKIAEDTNVGALGLRFYLTGRKTPFFRTGI